MLLEELMANQFAIQYNYLKMGCLIVEMFNIPPPGVVPLVTMETFDLYVTNMEHPGVLKLQTPLLLLCSYISDSTFGFQLCMYIDIKCISM